jgi:hypothetical protein
MLHSRITSRFVIACGAVLAGAVPAAALPNPDLDVTFIERTPRYDYDATPNNPEPGDVVTFHGHIKNWGPGSVAAVDYRWELDGDPVATGTLTDVAAGEERVVTWSWTFEDGDHWIKLSADPDDEVAESSEANNELEDRTNGLIVGFWVEQSVYDYFHQYQHLLGVGSNSWEDWAQRQMGKWNQLCEQAIWPISPEGVLDRVRIDKIIVVADGALPLGPWGLPTNHPDVRDKTVDLMWGFPATLLDGDFYANHHSANESNPFYIEQSLIHELGHARYLIDCYGFDVHNTAHHGGHDQVQIWEGDVYVGGSEYMPFIAWDEVLRYNHSGGVMSGPYGFQWSPYEAGALNLIAYERACCGNYNAPENIGVFLQDLPEHNHVCFVDQFGRPRAGANVRVYQAGPGPGWYGKTIDNTYELEFTTDAEGYAHMPENPFTDGEIQHTYGIANGVAVLRIAHNDQIWYRFLEVTDFNLAYWSGDTVDASYTMVIEGGETLPGDLDGDGDVDLVDLSVLLGDYGCTGGNCAGDVDGDGDTDLHDLAGLLAVYGVGA